MGALFLVFASVVLWILIYKWKKPRLPFPPGPKSLPLLGNALHVPFVRPWEKWCEWSETYKSDIIYLDLPFQPTIVIGSVKAAMELFDRRSHLYSSRNVTVMTKMMGWDYSFGLIPYGPYWRAHRRMFHQHFYETNVDQYKPIQLRNARAFLCWTLEAPEHTRKHIRQMVTSSIFSVMYGKKNLSMDHEYVIAAQTAIEGLSEIMVPGAFLIEYFPFLRHVPSWVPGANAQKVVEHYKPYVTATREKPFAEVQADIRSGIAPTSVAVNIIENIQTTYGGTKEEAFHMEIAKNVTGVAYAAGADTTTCGAEFFLLAMALFPEVQRKAQTQLDQVVGPTRLPDFDDLNEMPYIRAVTMETLRWFPITPFCIPHAIVDDDVYKGYHIPKGATVLANAWAMTRDHEDYPEPELFKPERFLNEDGSINPDVRDPSTIVFGFGRRICPGRHFAFNSLIIYIASTLHAFNVTAGVDKASGKPIELSTEIEGSIVIMPCKVPCGMNPRSEAVVQLIHEAAAEVEGRV